MKNAIIETKNLCKTFFTDGNQFHVTKNVNLEIYEDDFTIIMGSSGSGKSTLLYLLSGLEGADAGEIKFNDTNIEKYTEKKMTLFRRDKIGFVFQSINLVPTLTILENITVPGGLVEKDRKAVKERALKILDSLDIKQHRDKLPSQLSGGEQQRVAIARGLINSPKVLFADEPTGALNSSQSTNVMDILTNINNEGQTIVMVTHDIKAACRANRILFIKDGRIDGELRLDRFEAQKMEERERQIFSFLKEKGW